MPDARDQIMAAADAAPRWAAGPEGREPPPSHDDEAATSLSARDSLTDLVDPTTLFGIDPPQREYVIEEMLPKGAVTTLIGPGGAGKSLVALQAQISTAIGGDFLGFRVKKCKSLAFYCEDDAHEVHRRAKAICIHYGIWLKDIGLARWQGRFGKQNVIATFRDGMLCPTEFFDFILEAMRHTGAELLILDNIAQLFAGNENDRSMVTQFVNRLGQIAIEFDAAVLLLGHPGKSSVGLTAEFSGSTAWDAAARLRWLLSRPEQEKDGPEIDPDLRVLTKKKSNYSSIGDEIMLRWDNGAFQALNTAGPDMVDRIDQNTKASACQDAFLLALAKLETEGRKVTSKSRAGNYAPNEMIRMPMMQAWRKRQIEAAMQDLFDGGHIVELPYGSPSRGWTYLAPTSEKATNGGM